MKWLGVTCLTIAPKTQTANIRRMSEAPTTPTSQKSIAIHLQFVLQYFRCPTLLGKGNTISTPPVCIAVRLPFVLQYASRLYRSTFGKILVVVVTGMFPKIVSVAVFSTQSVTKCLSSRRRLFPVSHPTKISEVNKRGRPSKWPPECLPSKFADFECAFSL